MYIYSNDYMANINNHVFNRHGLLIKNGFMILVNAQLLTWGQWRIPDSRCISFYMSPRHMHIHVPVFETQSKHTWSDTQIHTYTHRHTACCKHGNILCVTDLAAVVSTLHTSFSHRGTYVSISMLLLLALLTPPGFSPPHFLPLCYNVLCSSFTLYSNFWWTYIIKCQ